MGAGQGLGVSENWNCLTALCAGLPVCQISTDSVTLCVTYMEHSILILCTPDLTKNNYG